MCSPPVRSKKFLHKSTFYTFLLFFIFFMIDVFSPKRISPDCLFKSNHRQVNISILFPWCAIYLRGMLHTAEIISAIWCTLRRSSMRCVAHRWDCLCGLHRDHLRGMLHGMLHTAEITLWSNIAVKSKPNSKIHTLGCLSGGRWVRIMKKIGGKNLVTHSL